MRMSEREVVGTANILEILDKCDSIRIGLSVNDRPYIVPMDFAFEAIGDSVSIYMHCAREGKKMDMIAKNNNVCFEADHSHEIIKAEAACHWGAKFESVMGEGKIFVVDDDKERVKAMDLLMRRHGFVGRPNYEPKALAAAAVLRISVTSMTGKRKRS
ncbi:MAG: pyridoxamine 5'-phosphate oxidase family protein [Methanomassiliicoccaceae archaeon]|jgi:nitroimidazol reductase NimA-like FMN-containing flavoprotein (pyridoxamine 5'-phosphate oxidase superfamily)|nr:pyridoxamine 5'-phosphate oxidase family protein [Methanomassiliicoccaceae archaeon]